MTRIVAVLSGDHRMRLTEVLPSTPHCPPMHCSLDERRMLPEIVAPASSDHQMKGKPARHVNKKRRPGMAVIITGTTTSAGSKYVVFQLVPPSAERRRSVSW